MEGFFMVWCPQRSEPTYRHGTQTAAMAEAKRLAANNQGLQFYVLAATHLVESNNVRVEQLTGVFPF